MSLTKISQDIQTESSSTETNTQRSSNSRIKLVTRSRSQDFLYTQKTSIKLFDDRCSGYRLGSSIRQDLHFGLMDKKTEFLALQQKRVVCGICCNKTGGSQIEEFSSTHSIGQSNSCGLHQEGRRYEIPRTIQSDLSIVESNGRIRDNVISILPSRVSSMGLRSGVDIFTSLSHAKSIIETQQKQRSIHNNSSKMGSNLLDSGPDQSKQRTTCINRKSQRSSDRSSSGSDYSSGVDHWMWGERTKNWSEQERNLIKGS